MDDRTCKREEKALRHEKIRHTLLLSLLTSLAVIFFVIESAIPNPFPWLRLGLANTVIIMVIVLYGMKDGLLVAFLRAMVGSVAIGTFLGPGFWLSISGGLASAFMMGFLYRFFSSVFSLIGISVIGAYIHSLTQIILVYFFLIQRKEIFYLLPIILFCSLIAGCINGLAAIFLLDQVKKVIPVANT